MSYRSVNNFHHESPETTGILLVNLGTPDAPDRASVRQYLKEFLWDPRVVEVPRPIWWLVLNLVILNTRPKRSAAAYAKVWSDSGSPLMVISRRQQEALRDELESRFGVALPVELAMRYGNPSIAQGLAELEKAGARRVLVLPLYPQYSATTTASVFDAVVDELKRWRWLPELRFIQHYHDDPEYINALASSVREFQAEHGRAGRLIMSFHGIPREYFDAGDPYYCECQTTARLLAGELELAESDYAVTFQSRLGPKQWLQPYTDKTLEKLAGEGVGSVQVICPGFSADCLETLEEIAMENREIFLGAGGEQYDFIPCLNTRNDHIGVLAGLVERHVQGWPIVLDSADRLSRRQARACALGADR